MFAHIGILGFAQERNSGLICVTQRRLLLEVSVSIVSLFFTGGLGRGGRGKMIRGKEKGLFSLSIVHHALPFLSFFLLFFSYFCFAVFNPICSGKETLPASLPQGSPQDWVLNVFSLSHSLLFNDQKHRRTVDGAEICDSCNIHRSYA